MNSIIVSISEGSKRARDLHLSRDKSGKYILVATQGYKNKNIYVANSDNINHFDLVLKNISSSDKDLSLAGNYSWAPEVVFDYKNNQYIILYSDPELKNSSIYAVTTKDFINYSYPFVFFDAGFTIIDANITLMDGRYYLFYKGEDNKRYGKIYYAVSDNLSYNSNWQIYDNPLPSNYKLEGPFGLKGFNNNYYLFVDAFKLSKSYFGLFDFDNNIDMKDISDLNGVNHYSILKITKKEYDRLKEG